MVVGVAWNAGTVRARLLERHRLGADGCRQLARRDGFDAALEDLRRGPYGHDVDADMTLASAQWAAAATPLWHIRVLAGWLPPAGGELLRTLAGWWEILNVENLLAELSGAASFSAYDLGTLSTAWSRMHAARSPGEVRHVLSASTWGDPGSDDVTAIVVWLRLAWADRVADRVADASRLAAGWAALQVARGVVSDVHPAGSSAAAHRVRCLGRGWREANGLPELRARLPRDAAWVLKDLDDPSDLWRGEVRWWRTLDDEARRLVRHPHSGPEAAVGALGVLLADAHRVQGALELAARGGADDETLDELL